VTNNAVIETELDARALVDALAACRWWIVGTTVLFAIALAVMGIFMKPVYRASSTLVPAAIDREFGGMRGALGQLGGVAALAGIDVGGGDSRVEEALAVLSSREFTEEFIRQNNLLTVLFADKWDVTTRNWKVPAERQPTLARGYKFFNKKVRFVTRDKKTGLVSLQVEWFDRETAAIWARDLVQRLNQEMRAREITRADAYVKFLEQELGSTSNVETRNAIGRLMEVQIKQRMLANVTQEFAFRVVDRALPPDADDPIRPQPVKMTLVGAVAGLVLSALWVIVAAGMRAPSPRARRNEARV
jgi:uncharacterized protein involved in exopolysaccharide biosynthesis